MKEKQEEYSGGWMKFGCFLSTLAILAIIGIILYMFYMLLNAKGISLF